MTDLLAHHPQIRGSLDSLAAGQPWGLTGVSALVYDDDGWYFEVTKPRHWKRHPDGGLQVGMGAIGGSLEPREALLECLAREACEEIGVDLEVISAPRTWIVYEGTHLSVLEASAKAEHPQPALLTVSRNLYRREALPGCEVLAIVTFLTRAMAPPARGDLHGLVHIPHPHLAAALVAPRLSLGHVRGTLGGWVQSEPPLDDDVELAPVWTVRSLQVVARAGLLGDLPAIV